MHALLEGESQKVFHLSPSEDEAKHISPETARRKLPTLCPKYLIWELQKVARLYLFAGMTSSLAPQMLQRHLNILARQTGSKNILLIVAKEES